VTESTKVGYIIFFLQYNWLVYRHSYSLSQYAVSVDDTLFLVSAISTTLLSTQNNNINANVERKCAESYDK